MAKENNATSKSVKKPQRERRFHPLRYLKEMMGEVKKLSWLSWKDLAKHTAAVVVFVLVMALVIWGLDAGFSAGVKGLSGIGSSISAEQTEPAAEPTAEPAAEPTAEATAEPQE